MNDFVGHRLEIETFRCRCGNPINIPIRQEWNSPLYIMEMEREHARLWKQIDGMHKALMELAQECVDAGVRPSCLRRADELKELLQLMLEKLKNEEDKDVRP